jgi:hypothetical protein
LPAKSLISPEACANAGVAGITGSYSATVNGQIVLTPSMLDDYDKTQ